jgi:hypothetical protein
MASALAIGEVTWRTIAAITISTPKRTRSIWQAEKRPGD